MLVLALLLQRQSGGTVVDSFDRLLGSAARAWLSLVIVVGAGVAFEHHVLPTLRQWSRPAWVLGLAAALGFAYFIWPTPYPRFTCVLPDDVEAPRASRPACLATTARENRFTGRVDILLPGNKWASTVAHWYPQEPGADYEDEGL